MTDPKAKREGSKGATSTFKLGTNCFTPTIPDPVLRSGSMKRRVSKKGSCEKLQPVASNNTCVKLQKVVKVNRIPAATPAIDTNNKQLPANKALNYL